MRYLRTKQQRQSARLTTLIAIVLVLLFFVVGPSYMDPPTEYGVVVNFGTSNVGEGTTQPKVPTNSNPNPNNTPEAVASEPTAVTDPSTSSSDEVLTSDASAEIPIKKAQNEVEKIKSEAEAKAQAEAERQRNENEAKEQKKKELDALIGGIGSGTGTDYGAEGDDANPGDKGQLDGNPYAPSYFGNSGSGFGGVGYGLNGRGEPDKSKILPDCDEEGRVVVEIHVNRNGEVTHAIPGKRGTTGDICLYEAAKKTAQTHKWPADNKAPIKQVGFVIVEFSVRQ